MLQVAGTIFSLGLGSINFTPTLFVLKARKKKNTTTAYNLHVPYNTDMARKIIVSDEA